MGLVLLVMPRVLLFSAAFYVGFFSWVLFLGLLSAAGEEMPSSLLPVNWNARPSMLVTKRVAEMALI